MQPVHHTAGSIAIRSAPATLDTTRRLGQCCRESPHTAGQFDMARQDRRAAESEWAARDILRCSTATLSFRCQEPSNTTSRQSTTLSAECSQPCQKPFNFLPDTDMPDTLLTLC